MPTHSEARFVPYAPEQMYDLVADISAYPEFIPWCAGARIRSRTQERDTEIILADLMVSFKVFREKFASRVTLHPAAQRIDTQYIEGPFRHMQSHWEFAWAEGGCTISFFVDFEFRNPVLERIIGVVFHEAMRRIVRAFEARAQALYG